jgi:hypothetical protein
MRAKRFFLAVTGVQEFSMKTIVCLVLLAQAQV